MRKAEHRSGRRYTDKEAARPKEVGRLSSFAKPLANWTSRRSETLGEQLLHRCSGSTWRATARSRLMSANTISTHARAPRVGLPRQGPAEALDGPALAPTRRMHRPTRRPPHGCFEAGSPVRAVRRTIRAARPTRSALRRRRHFPEAGARCGSAPRPLWPAGIGRS